MAGRGRKPVRPGTLKALADVLPAVSDQLHLDRKVQEMALLALWPQLVGASYAAHTRAMALKKRGDKQTLLVKVANAALASDLSFQLPVLQEALNRYEPQTGLKVDAIHLMVGSL